MVRALLNRLFSTEQAAYSLPSNPSQGMVRELIVKKANSWRDQWNPLRGLTMARAIQLLEAGERGEFADLQWLYRFIEMTDPTLVALLARYDGGLLKLDWDIKLVDDDQIEETGSMALAEDQQATLKEAYNRIGNLRCTFSHLISARFRGYAHLQKWTADDVLRLSDQNPNLYGEFADTSASGSDIVRLEPVEQWYWCRQGLNGAWNYNPKASSGARVGQEINYEDFIIRECPRPVNRIGLINFLYANLARKDWAGFIEEFGIPPTFIIGPPGVDKAKEQEFLSVAQRIISDSRGYLPNGSTVATVGDAIRGTQPFKEFLDDLRAMTVLAGTGGKLTMLTESGSGTLAGGAHQDAWEDIVQAEASQISEEFQKQFDEDILEAAFPGKPRLAYFEICANEETDTKAVIDEIEALSRAGYQVDPEEVSEKTGYTVTLKPQPSASPFGPFGGADMTSEDTTMANRAGSAAMDKLLNNVLENLTHVEARWLGGVKPYFRDLVRLAQDGNLSDADFVKAVEKARGQMPELFNRLEASHVADALEKAMGAAMVNGAVQGAMDRRPARSAFHSHGKGAH